MRTNFLARAGAALLLSTFAAACGGAVSGRVSPRHRAPPRATTATSATRPHSQAWRLRGGASAGRLRRRRLRAGCSSGSGWVGSLRGTS